MNLDKLVVTTEDILSITTQEKIFEKYLFPPILKARYKNPFRVDGDPGCSFYYKNEKLYFVDWAWNKKHYDCFQVVMEYYKCTITQAIRYIQRDIESGEIERMSSADVEIQRVNSQQILRVKKRNYTEEELKFWCKGGLNITQDILECHGIYAVETIWENDWVIDNCRMTFVYIENNYITQVYFPLNKNTGRRRFINQRGYLVGGIDALPFISTHAVISKSRKCRFFMNVLDITSINIINETVVIEEDIYNNLKTSYKNVFYLGDNDYPGKRLAVLYRKKYPDIIILLFPKGEPKDFTDNLETYGKDYMIKLRDTIYDKFIK